MFWYDEQAENRRTVKLMYHRDLRTELLIISHNQNQTPRKYHSTTPGNKAVKFKKSDLYFTLKKKSTCVF